MEVVCGIYKITSPSGKIYVGQSYNIKNRWRRYRQPAFCIRNQQVRLVNSLLKYGHINHVFEIIEECNHDICQQELDNLEIKYITLFDCLGKNGLNVRGGGSRGKLAAETVQKMRERIVTAETRMKCSIALKGKTPWNKGIPRTDEVKNKLRIAHQGIPSSRKGVKLSPETKEKLRQANIGKKYSYETNSKKGKFLSDERKAHLRALYIGDANPFKNKSHSKEKLQQIGAKVSESFQKRKENGLKTTQYIEIYKIDPVTNEILETYDSVIKAAKDNNIGKNHIHEVISKKIFYRITGESYIKEQAGGFKWAALNSDYKVNKIDPMTRSILATYNSIPEAASNNNLSPAPIDIVINHRVRQLQDGGIFVRMITGGFMWKKDGTNG
jgi:group I intron endonuclease